MNKSSDWIITFIVVIAALTLCSYFDSYEESQRAADELIAAQSQEKMDLSQARVSKIENEYILKNRDGY